MMRRYCTGFYGILFAAFAAAGCSAEDGANGADGEKGANGAPGMDGADGEKGADGAPGMDGIKGDDGEPGEDGLTTLITQTGVGPGTDCEFGGVRIDSGSDADNSGTLEPSEIDNTSFICNYTGDFMLQLLHFADVDGNGATALANLDDFSALVDGFSNDPFFGPRTLVVSSGDNMIPGPRYFAAENAAVRAITGSNEPGHADHFFMNAFGVAASALGNHDLDQGPGEFADSLLSESSGGVTFPGTRFPYLAANVDFSTEILATTDLSVGVDGTDYRDLGQKVAGSAIAYVRDEKIGLVGVSTPQLTTITSTGALVINGSVTEISELAAAVQPTIDALTDSGVNKIIVLAHLQQIAFEKALAAELKDVDIIVAGGSNTRMGDSTDTLYPGDSAFAEGYPYETTDSEDKPILVVNTDGDYKYLGRLVVSFDANGVIIPDSISEVISGAYAATPSNVLLSGGTPIAEVVTVRDALETVIKAQYENVLSHTTVFLEGRREKVRTEETNMGNISTDSMKWYAERCTELSGQSVLALKNGGGIRSEIGNAVVTGEETELFPPFNDGLAVDPGDVSEGHLRSTFSFDNGLVVFDVTGEELKMLLEHAVAATAPGATPGQFPQVAGISLGFDPTGTAQVATTADGVITAIATPGTRVTDLWVDTDGDFVPDTALYIGGVAQAAATDTFAVTTLNFLANGGDNYPFALLSNPNRRQLYTGAGFGDPPGTPTVLTDCDPGLQSTFSRTGGEQDVLAEYLIAEYPNSSEPFDIAETPPAEDRRIQNLSIISDFIAPN